MKVKVGQVLMGEINGIVPYGIFVKFDSQQGLVHISEISNNFVSGLDQNFKIGDQVEVKVIDIDAYSGQISLSIRALNQDDSGKNIPRKRFWTNRHIHTGYQALENSKSQMVKEAMKRLEINE